MQFSNKYSINPFWQVFRVGQQLVIIALVIMMSACATMTGGERKPVNKVVKQSCSATAAVDDQNSQNKTPKLNKDDCLPRGVYEISENFGVDPEIRGEFNQAVTLLNSEKYSEAIRLLRAVSGKASKFSAAETK